MRNQSLALTPSELPHYIRLHLSLTLSSNHTVNRLHPELLSSIFLIALEQQKIDIVKEETESVASSSTELDLTNHPIPLVVSAVSKYWRDVAHTTARLWSDIDFHDPLPNYPYTYPFTRILLERSRRALLTVTMTLLDTHDALAVAEMTNIIVPEHVGRVESLTLTAPNIEQVERVLAAFVNHVDAPPPLVELSVAVGNATGEQIDVRSPSARRAQLVNLMNGIRRLSLEGVRFPWKTPAFANLTHLRIASSSVAPGCRPTEEEFISILHASPELESLIISQAGVQLGEGEDVSSVNQHEPVEMKSLVTLELMEIGWMEMVFLLNVINTPRLRGLRICSPEETYDADGNTLDEEDLDAADDAVCDAVTRFLINAQQPAVSEEDERSGFGRIRRTSTIKSLELESLCHEELGSQRLKEILLEVPNLQALSLIELDFDPDVLSSMQGIWGFTPDPMQGPEPHWICPNVDWLKLQSIEGIEFNDVVQRKRLLSSDLLLTR